MVKNTKGGKGAKSMARKSVSVGGAGGYPIPTSDMEHIAIVEKIFGPSCSVYLQDGTKLLCHIRNKFKGRHKSRNLIRVGTFLLIGYREWEPDTSRKNCDLMFVYDDLQSSAIAERFMLPSIPGHSTTTHDDILFDNFSSDIINDTIDTNTHAPGQDTIANSDLFHDL